MTQIGGEASESALLLPEHETHVQGVVSESATTALHKRRNGLLSRIFGKVTLFQKAYYLLCILIMEI